MLASIQPQRQAAHFVHGALPITTEWRVVGSTSRGVVLDRNFSQTEYTIICNFERSVQHLGKKAGMVLCEFVERGKVAIDLGNHGQ
jgi:hypothetical protein